MYNFSDPKVLEMLQRVINTYAKIGELLNIVATSETLGLSVLNSSQTVLARVNIIKPLFSGEGTSRNVNVKARALDLVLKRIEPDQITAMQLVLDVSTGGQEHLSVKLMGNKGILKVFTLPSLHTAVEQVDFEPLEPGRSSFECLPSTLKDAFSSCEAGADELQIIFRPTFVTLHARKKSHTRSSNRSTAHSTLSSANHSSKETNSVGLRTVIKLQFDAFHQITALAPRQVELKFKEFRTMLNFLDYIGGGTPLRAEFNETSRSMPIVFTGKYAAFPLVSFVFKFMARASGPRIEDLHQIRVGNQDQTPSAISLPPRARINHSDGPPNEFPELNNRARRVLRTDVRIEHEMDTDSLIYPVSNAQFRTPSMEMRANSTSTSTAQGIEMPPSKTDAYGTNVDVDIDYTTANSPTEIGYTQDPDPVGARGIFD